MTSATFAFVGIAPAAALTTIYQHIDGDLYGASRYLRAMLALDYSNEYAATNFLRGNLAAGLDMGSIVTDHDVYLSTSFRYTLEGDNILAEERLIDYEPEFKTVFNGPLVDFLNNQPGMMLHHVALYPEGRLGYYTLEQLEAYLAAERGVVARMESKQVPAADLAAACERAQQMRAVVVAAFAIEEPEYVVPA
jgi:hypothetical protein